MTKFLTTAAWAALVMGGVAVADTPPSEAAEVIAEESATVEADVSEETTTITMGDEAEAKVEESTDATVASATIKGEASAGGEAIEAEEASMEESESE